MLVMATTERTYLNFPIPLLTDKVSDNSEQDKGTKVMKEISKGCSGDRTCRLISEPHRQRSQSIQSRTNLMDFFRMCLACILVVFLLVGYNSQQNQLTGEGFLSATV